MQLFCDLDGVLADLDRHYLATFGTAFHGSERDPGWVHKVKSVASFWADIPPMPDAMELWDYIAPHRPIIITGVPTTGRAAAVANKVAWVKHHISGDIHIITCQSSDKSRYCKRGDVLIDDWDKYRPLWENKGGRWILHTTAKQSIGELKEMGL